MAGFRYATMAPYFRPTLKHLHIDAYKHGPSSTDLLQVLSRMPLLQTLMFTHIPHADSSDMHSQEVALPFLRHLSLLGSSSACADLLECLRFPSTAILEIAVNVTPLSDYISPEIAVVAVTLSLGPALRGKLRDHANIGDPDSILEATLDNWDLKFYSPKDLRGTKHLHRSSGGDHICKLSIYEIIREVFEPVTRKAGPLPFFHGALPTANNVRFLTINTGFFSKVVPFLTAFTRVESLHIIAHSALSRSPALLKLYAVDCNHLFPLLRRLHLTRFWFGIPGHDSDIRPTLEDVLSSRMEWGSGITQLAISKAVGFSIDDVMRLREFVEEVDWDEVI